MKHVFPIKLVSVCLFPASLKALTQPSNYTCIINRQNRCFLLSQRNEIKYSVPVYKAIFMKTGALLKMLTEITVVRGEINKEYVNCQESECSLSSWLFAIFSAQSLSLFSL